VIRVQHFDFRAWKLEGRKALSVGPFETRGLSQSENQAVLPPWSSSFQIFCTIAAFSPSPRIRAICLDYRMQSGKAGHNSARNLAWLSLFRAKQR
jgi:hypothetical protein